MLFTVKFWIRRLRHDSDGGITPLMCLIFVSLIGCMGVAIDTGRAMVVKARLVNALDAAGLAVGARTSTKDYNGDARKFVDANFKANYAQATVTSVTATLSTDKALISLAATATMPTIFMKMFGSSVVTVKATSEVTRASTGLELVLVLDNTGSMEQSNSMPALKAGATSLVNGLLSDAQAAKKTYVGLVPFSQAVNIGPDLTQGALWTDISSVVRAGYPKYWTGCVEARTGGFDQTDDPPALFKPSTLLKVYYSPDTGSGSNTQKNNWITTNFWGQKVYDIYYTDYSNNGQQGPAAFCPQPLTPMTNDKTKVLAGINAMTAQGSTMIGLGAVWGWRMLSPRWRGTWSGDMAANSLPLDYNTRNMTKVLVLMTDGENSFTEKLYTAYGFLDDNRLGTTKRKEGEDELDARLTTVCNAIKIQGIEIFTIAYDNPKKETKALLEACATNTNYYFDAKNTSDLIEKFELIQSALSKLRVSR